MTKRILWGATFALLAGLALALCINIVTPDQVLAGVVMAEGVAVADFKAMETAVKAAMKAMEENAKRFQDTATTAIEELKRNGGVMEAKTNDVLAQLGTVRADLGAKVTDALAKVNDLALAADKRPGGPEAQKSAGQLVAESPQYKAMLASGEFKSGIISMPRATIASPEPYSNDQPLVPAQRLPGIAVAPQRRLTIRDLLPQLRATSNLVEFCRELVFTNNAGPQFDATSPTNQREGATKNQSNITFELASAPVVTLAHWIGASRQVLKDATMLRGYIDTRLAYGLKLEEEDELLNSAGANGELTGLVSSATAFTGASTNQTFLDTLLKAFLQVSLAEDEASAVVMHPQDWTSLMLAKDTQGRYLFSDPQAMSAPRVWGKPVVPTQSMTQGTWLTGAFDIGATIWDSEDINIRVSDSHQDFFIRNLVAILCEERLALTVYRTASFVTGSVSYAG
jgi:HK97 family phage major capsid protein